MGCCRPWQLGRLEPRRLIVVAGENPIAKATEALVKTAGTEVPDGAPLDRKRLRDTAVHEYRASVMGQLAISVDWRGLEWTDDTACDEDQRATPAHMRDSSLSFPAGLLHHFGCS